MCELCESIVSIGRYFEIYLSFLHKVFIVAGYALMYGEHLKPREQNRYIIFDRNFFDDSGYDIHSGRPSYER